MALSVQDLLDLEKMPAEDEITLQTIALFYEEHLCNRIFYYKIRDKRRDIKLHFRTFDLPHLLGVHKVKTGSAFRGRKGFPELKLGKLTLEMLKQANVGGYESVIQRILHFPFLHQLMHNPSFLIFNPQIAGSMIDAEFMLYNVFSGRYIHLGIKKEESTDMYIPVTFLERKKPYQGMRIVQIDEMQIIPDQG